MDQLGFARTRDDDYVNEKWGLRVEDLHEENALLNSGGVGL